MTTEDWRDAAYCRDDPTPDLWHMTDRYGIAAARAMCAKCPVASACLAEALADPSLTGVWGGTTDEERKGLRKPRSWRCGTAYGHKKHLQLREESCAECRAASQVATQRDERRRKERASA
jgi:WhiB family redox-sensing transcriptional regulator